MLADSNIYTSVEYYLHKKCRSYDRKSHATPSPQSVGGFDRTADLSSLVSRMLCDHLVTVNDDEVIVRSTTVTLPELEEATATSAGTPYHHRGYRDRHYDDDDDDDDDDDGRCDDATDYPPVSSSLISSSSSPREDGRHHLPYHPAPPVLVPVHHKMLYQSLSSFASPVWRGIEEGMDEENDDENDREDHDRRSPTIRVGPERVVIFHSDSLGIKISRHTDGYVRVLSASPSSSSSSQSSSLPPAGSSSERQHFPPSREGEVRSGDVVREVGGVSLRSPINTPAWKLTVGLIRMAPRPLRFVVANDLTTDATTTTTTTTTTLDAAAARRDDVDERRRSFGPRARVVTFHEPCLGVRLRHDQLDGRVRVLDVTPMYRSFPGRPTVRTGDEVRPGDIVLNVGDGEWDLNGPIDADDWCSLIGPWGGETVAHGRDGG